MGIIFNILASWPVCSIIHDVCEKYVFPLALHLFSNVFFRPLLGYGPPGLLKRPPPPAGAAGNGFI